MASVASDDAELARQLEDVREQQRAISGVLRAVARSAGIQPVLDEVVEACERLCRADYGALYLLEHGLLHVAAHNTQAAGAEYDRQHPHALDRTTGAGRAAVAREPVHIPDIREDPGYSYGGPTEYYRSLIAVPVMVEDDLIGVVVLVRREPKPFTEEHIALVQSFADQGGFTAFAETAALRSCSTSSASTTLRSATLSRPTKGRSSTSPATG
jgi:two-component system, NtrC family, sensor kinase